MHYRRHHGEQVGSTVHTRKTRDRCHGDGDIAARAGAPFRIDPKKKLQGLTVSFGCSGVDRGRFLEYVAKRSPVLGLGKNKRERG